MATATSTTSQLLSLPDELLESIVCHLPPDAAIAFGSTSKQCNKIVYEPLVWRRHCMQGWRYWHEKHAIEDKLEQPPIRTKWRQVYSERRRIDKVCADEFEDLLASQQHRLLRIENIAKMGNDARGILQERRDDTPDDAEDVLARRYHASMILGRINRTVALDKWRRLQNSQMVSLQDVLGAFDLFAIPEGRGDLHAIDAEVSRLAEAIRRETQEFDQLSTRRKAVVVAEHLRMHNVIGNPVGEDYHALRNNYLSLILLRAPHTALPLQTAAVYCAVARKLGIDARPSNFPQHVHVVIMAPRGQSLDGAPREMNADLPTETMHLDPWHSAEEVPDTQLMTRLLQLGAPSHELDQHLGAASNSEIVQRTARNIMNSAQEARRYRSIDQPHPADDGPEIEAAWYSMLWVFMILGESDSRTAMHRRRHCLPYILPHYQQHFPEDLGLVEEIVLPMFQQEPEWEDLLRHINSARVADGNKPPPSPRDTPAAQAVQYKIGQFFMHRRYRYEGMIIGWDAQCNADAQWIQAMNVDGLARGRMQPFYNVVSGDKSVRYVAEENISLEKNREPCAALMRMAGKWFKRWDAAAGRFVSNIKDEYPDD